MPALLLLAALGAQTEGLPWLTQVVPGPKRHFHRDDLPGCPALTERCRRAGYVVAGDQLIAWERKGALTRAEYIGPSGKRTEGWIESAGLKRIAPPNPPLAAWIGKWGAGDADIVIKRSPRAGRLLVTGFATWHQNDGEIAGEITPVNGRGAFAMGDIDERGGVIVTDWLGDSVKSLPFDAPGEYRCRVQLWLLPPYLIVDDGYRCGGLNVTFTGVFRK